MKAALIVAHPDDESLWFAGYVLHHPHDWTIICCSIPRIDPVRAWKFFDACAVLGAKPRLIPVTETAPDQPLPALHLLDLKGYDLIVTHGNAPEPGYGFQHAHHRHVHCYIKHNFVDKSSIRFLGGPEAIRLTSEELARKQEALRCYDHVLPYSGKLMTKWEALLHRYCETGGYDLATENYA